MLKIMSEQNYILTIEKPVNMVQTTEEIQVQEIQTIIMPLKEGTNIIEFN